MFLRCFILLYFSYARKNSNITDTTPLLMQLFYTPEVDFTTNRYILSAEESRHCIRVLRLRPGDGIHITDGRGTLCAAQIIDATPHGCELLLGERTEAFEKRNYTLHVAIAPTKNIDRLEWFVEKATEIGIDRITPLLTDHCERRTVKTDRLIRVATGAVKQSLKAYHPLVDELTPFQEIVSTPFNGKKLIAHCETDLDKILLQHRVQPEDAVLILIGPEGDFSPEEIALAYKNGFSPVSLGKSRLRTETAAVVATHSIAFINEK